jgi:hypothetical protein
LLSFNKTYIWWEFLCLVAVVNILIWSWALGAHSEMQNFSSTQAILSGLYVLVCAFRSFFPRIDLERYCLFDIALSSIVLGRSLATLAEICFSIQCALLIYDLGIYMDSKLVILVAYSVVPLIVIAQAFCWYATLTLNHFWHGMEEVMWIVMIVLAAGCFITGFFMTAGMLKVLMAVGIVSCLGAGYIMLFVDIPMYFSRTQTSKKNGRRYLAIGEGIQDALSRRVQTSDWSVWKHEVMWISSYFTFGVWMSIGMIFIKF